MASIDLEHARNGRLATDPDAIRRLRDQIATSGLINPITVRPQGSRFTLIAGLNRVEAYKLLQRTKIPAHVVSADDAGASTMRLAENLTRTNLSPIEEAAQLGDLVEASAGGVDAVAATIGRSVNWVLDRLEILSWDVELQQAVHAHKVSVAAAKRLARIPDPETRHRYVLQAVAHGINARTAALWLQDAIAQQAPDFEPSEKPNLEVPILTPPEVLVNCFTCGEKTSIGNTYPVRLCPTCIEAIQRSCLQGGAPQETHARQETAAQDLPSEGSTAT